MTIKQRAQAYLRTSLNNPQASFHDGQWESIEQLLNRNRVLVVQRTGWGKSMVYFLATKLLREQGAGPTLLISPLLSLMRNQLEAAQRIGVTARTINSANNDEWPGIEAEIKNNQVDVLLISPERLGKESFVNSVLSSFSNNVGLFVIDEAHCISDWGHDFRPDYKRIVRILNAFPSNIPVLATTATANDRVVNDVTAQLGNDINIIRGSLVRESLRLQNITMKSPAARMAWVAKTVEKLQGAGIIYCLTKRDADRICTWLQVCGLEALSYYNGVLPKEELILSLASSSGMVVDEISSLNTNELSSLYREFLEQKLLSNEIKVLVATVALGMGFDKPDLEFVIHFQRPASVVHYYQQVGRAGRAVDEAYGVLLHGEEDEQITNYFIKNAFPPQNHIERVLELLKNSEYGLSTIEMTKQLNLREGQIKDTLQYLSVESPSPVTKIKTKWSATASADIFKINSQLIEEITDIRNSEQQQMRDYMEHTGCLMTFLQTALDDPSPHHCGKCMNCNPSGVLDETYDDDLANRAGLFLRRTYQPIPPRKQWPAKDMFQRSPLGAYKIPEASQAQEGRALSLWRDAGWGQLVAHGKYQESRFSDDLVTACVEMLQTWSPDPAPKWVTCIPSLNHPELVPDFAARLAGALGLPFVSCIEKARANRQQKEMENSYQQVKNLDGVFNITDQCLPGECLLIDDMIDSGWTFTVASALLRQTGCSAVYPMALALNSPRME